jgi:hypothetical protein
MYAGVVGKSAAVRKALTSLTILVTLALGVPTTSAHVARSFDACIGQYPPHGRCRDRATYLVGDHPHIRAQIKPAHTQLRVTLWRRAPPETWAKLRTVAISTDGHMV